MSSGIVHARITAVLVVPTAVSFAVITNDPALGVAGAAGAGLNILMGPDLDQTGLTQNELILPRPLRLVWAWIWYPYAFLIPHRSPLSHAPLLGTAVRVAYLSILVGTILFLFDSALMRGGYNGDMLETAVRWLGSVRPDVLLATFAGLCVADSAHFLEDVRFSSAKKAKRKVTK